MGQKRPLNVPVPEASPAVVHGQTDTPSIPATENAAVGETTSTTAIKVKKTFDDLIIFKLYIMSNYIIFCYIGLNFNYFLD